MINSSTLRCLAFAVVLPSFSVVSAQTLTTPQNVTGPLVVGWQAGERLRFTVESIIDTVIPGELGEKMHVRLRNDVRAEVLELLTRGEARVALTFDRVRIEETDDEGHRETDTRSDPPEKRENNPWAHIVGKPIEVISHPGEGRLSLVNADELVQSLSGKDPQRAMVLGSLLKPADLAGLVEFVKPLFSTDKTDLQPGMVWKDHFNPRIPQSDIQLIGVTRVGSTINRRIVLDSLFILPPRISPEKLLANQMEFKVLGARYQQIKADRTLAYDPQRRTCSDMSLQIMLELEGKLAGKALNISCLQKTHCWLLEHSVAK